MFVFRGAGHSAGSQSSYHFHIAGHISFILFSFSWKSSFSPISIRASFASHELNSKWHRACMLCPWQLSCCCFRPLFQLFQTCSNAPYISRKWSPISFENDEYSNQWPKEAPHMLFLHAHLRYLIVTLKSCCSTNLQRLRFFPPAVFCKWCTKGE